MLCQIRTHTHTAATDRDVFQLSAAPIATTHQSSSLCVQASNESRPQTDEPEEILNLTLLLSPNSPINSIEGIDLNTNNFYESDWGLGSGQYIIMKNYRLIFMPSQFLFFKYLTHTQS